MPRRLNIHPIWSYLIFIGRMTVLLGEMRGKGASEQEPLTDQSIAAEVKTADERLLAFGPAPYARHDSDMNSITSRPAVSMRGGTRRLCLAFYLPTVQTD